jgi:hypothetical protein
VPDFADRRVRSQAARARARRSPPPGQAARAPGERLIGRTAAASTKVKESPLGLFRKLLGDFQHGLSALKQISLKAPAASSEKVFSVQRSSEIGFQTRLTERILERTIRMPGRAIPLGYTRGKVTGNRRSNVKAMLGADREARTQVQAGRYDGSPSHLPSAARLAQILRADELLRSGTGTPNPQVHSWAQAVREGRRREIADLDADYVQNTLSAALGGPTRAEQLLSSPYVHSLVERHRTAVEAIHRNLHDANRADSRGFTRMERGSSHARRSAAPASIVTGSASAPAAVPSARPIPSSSSYEPVLARMLAGNEEPHLALAGMDETERARHEDRRLSRFPAASAARRELSSSMSMAPFGRPAQPSASQSQASTPARKMELTGRMTLTGVGGQPLGMAEIDAEGR